ncbi:septum site-determining protein MinC [Shewanella cyperi]|uniref:Probable septum site-determining protein MinC n=1 Tax=Shewanella cyperi TaxID=2814292 RepID=A0A975AMJ8_9GAMM|nr:septum site-determining protein MinC [Shewanella cyperi]QSX31532.1 septum site-determining protein MinC [Shewanella cyperi]QSX42312.1 septum site-determining protein MinC [Shewanella cyperi]
MPKASLELKGSSFTLSVLHINSKDLDSIATELDSKLAQAPQFFLGAPLVVNLSALSDGEVDLAALKQLLESRQLVIVGVTGASNPLSEQAKALGLAILKAGKESKTPPPPPRNTRIVKQNVRSGQQIYVKDGDLVIFGAVGNGAEVIADGSIHIYGALRGKAMAGASGDANAVILAQSLEAELVSIAGQYWLTENLQKHVTSKSGCIRLVGESLTVESLPQ